MVLISRLVDIETPKGEGGIPVIQTLMRVTAHLLGVCKTASKSLLCVQF